MRAGTDGAVHETVEATGEYELDRPISNLLSTTRDVLFSPRRFFDGLPPDGPLGAPVVYFLISSGTTALINTVTTLAFLAVPAAVALATGSLEEPLLVRILAIFVQPCASPATRLARL